MPAHLHAIHSPVTVFWWCKRSMRLQINYTIYPLMCFNLICEKIAPHRSFYTQSFFNLLRVFFMNLAIIAPLTADKEPN